MIDVDAKITGTEFNRNGFRLTTEALKQIVDDAEGKPVWDSFESRNEIGSISHASIDDDGWVTMMVRLRELPLGASHIVPCVAVFNDDYKEGVIHNIGWVCGCAFTNEPADQNLPPITIKEAQNEATG